MRLRLRVQKLTSRFTIRELLDVLADHVDYFTVSNLSSFGKVSSFNPLNRTS